MKIVANNSKKTALLPICKTVKQYEHLSKWSNIFMFMTLHTQQGNDIE